MRLGRLLIIFAIVVILGLAAVYAIIQLSNQDEGANADAIAMTDIVIVVQPIPRGGVVTADMLDFLAFPTGETIETMLTTKEAAVGLQARYDLEPGITLTSNMLAGNVENLSTTGSDSALLIPAGMVAFPITMDRFSSLAYGLRAGDHVNVISSMLFVDLDANFQSETPNNAAAIIEPGNTALLNAQDADSSSFELVIDELLRVLTAQVASGGSSSPLGEAIVDPVLNQPFYVVPSETQRPRLVSQTLLQNVVVLHVGNFIYTDENGDEVANAYEPQSPGLDSAGQPLPAAPKSPPDIITLIVSPQDAVTLNYLLYTGAKLTMALRSSGDDSVASTEAVTLDYLVDSYEIPVPSKVPFGMEPSIRFLSSPPLQGALP